MDDHGWDTPDDLRSRSDADDIEGQDSFSGRWRPIWHPYWNDCVIPVKWRAAAVREADCGLD